MSNFFSPQESSAPKSIPGMEWVGPLLKTVSAQALAAPAYGDILSQLVGGQNAYTGWVQQGANMLGGLDANALLGTLSTLLRPAMVETPFAQGAANLREQANLTGNLASGATQGSIVDFLGQLEQGFQAALPQYAQALGGLQLQAGQGLTGLGMQGLAAGQQESQFERDFLTNIMGALGQNQSMYQPTYGPSKFQSLIGGTAPIAAAAVGNPNAKFPWMK